MATFVATFIAVVAFLVAIGGVLWMTRKKPGRRYDKPPPGRSDADRDNWGFPG